MHPIPNNPVKPIGRKLVFRRSKQKAISKILLALGKFSDHIVNPLFEFRITGLGIH